MNRRALLALLGISTVLGGCLGDAPRTIEMKEVDVPGAYHLIIRDDDCHAAPPEMLEICNPVSTNHQISSEQHQQLVDRFDELRYTILVTVPADHPQGPSVGRTYTVARDTYNKLTVEDEIVELEAEQRGSDPGYSYVTEIEFRETGEKKRLSCDLPP